MSNKVFNRLCDQPVTLLTEITSSLMNKLFSKLLYTCADVGGRKNSNGQKQNILAIMVDNLDAEMLTKLSRSLAKNQSASIDTLVKNDYSKKKTLSTSSCEL